MEQESGSQSRRRRCRPVQSLYTHRWLRKKLAELTSRRMGKKKTDDSTGVRGSGAQKDNNCNDTSLCYVMKRSHSEPKRSCCFINSCMSIVDKKHCLQISLPKSTIFSITANFVEIGGIIREVTLRHWPTVVTHHTRHCFRECRPCKRTKTCG
jgi:hypothetical protein